LIVAGYDLDLNAMRLVSFSHGEDPVWITERDKIIAAAQGIRFMDITETPDLASFAAPSLKKEYSQSISLVAVSFSRVGQRVRGSSREVTWG
jgi:hypothetical protein